MHCTVTGATCRRFSSARIRDSPRIAAKHLCFRSSARDDERKKPKESGSLLDRLKQSISKTRTQITAKVEDLISGEKKIDPELLTKLENALLAADLGPADDASNSRSRAAEA